MCALTLPVEATEEAEPEVDVLPVAPVAEEPWLLPVVPGVELELVSLLATLLLPDVLVEPLRLEPEVLDAVVFEPVLEPELARPLLLFPVGLSEVEELEDGLVVVDVVLLPEPEEPVLAKPLLLLDGVVDVLLLDGELDVLLLDGDVADEVPVLDVSLLAMLLPLPELLPAPALAFIVLLVVDDGELVLELLPAPDVDVSLLAKPLLED